MVRLFSIARLVSKALLTSILVSLSAFAVAQVMGGYGGYGGGMQGINPQMMGGGFGAGGLPGGFSGMGGGLGGATGVIGFGMGLGGDAGMAEQGDLDVPGGVAVVPAPGTGTQPKPKTQPLPPNEFQKFVLQTTGQAYPLFGSSFFENTLNNITDPNRLAVGDDYTLGVGDELLIRVWGSINLNTRVTVDRKGEIALPKLGTTKVAGLKASQIEPTVRTLLAQNYKDFKVSVVPGRLRRITVYVVGQARNPGSYTLNSESTLTSGLFASGGPNPTGSIRRVQLMRQGNVIAEFDLYSFLNRGDKSSDLRLLDGDVLVYPKAVGHLALVGKVNAPGVFEIKDPTETLGDFLNLAGGMPVVADPRRATLERLSPSAAVPRRLEEFALDAQGLKKPVSNGDVVSVLPIVPELANVVTLRGSVAQPARYAWKSGMRVSDIITGYSVLKSAESLRRQNELLFDGFEQERAARARIRVPADLGLERRAMLKESRDLAAAQTELATAANAGRPPEAALAVAPNSPAALAAGLGSLGGVGSVGQNSPSPASQGGRFSDGQGEGSGIGQGIAGPGGVNQAESLLNRIGKAIEEVNLDYAVIERIEPLGLRVSVLPFSIGNVLADPNSPDNLALQAGDIITVFSDRDLHLPQAKRRVFVRIEGEVNRPGVYQVMPGERLTNLLQKAGGTTSDSYLFGMGIYRESVKQNQRENLEKLVRRVEQESSGAVAAASQSVGASSDPGAFQARAVALQQARQDAIQRLRMIRPEGRVTLSLKPDPKLEVAQIPDLRLFQGDRIYVPARPDFVYVYGAVNTEAALIYQRNADVASYLKLAGVTSGADSDAVILLRADGSAVSNPPSFWGNEVLKTVVMPGDTIVMPEKVDRESKWSVFVRNSKDITQTLFQLGLGAAALKTLRQ
jgi:protein involved in polysaccharide export with SLBB domain